MAYKNVVKEEDLPDEEAGDQQNSTETSSEADASVEMDRGMTVSFSGETIQVADVEVRKDDVALALAVGAVLYEVIG